MTPFYFFIFFLKRNADLMEIIKTSNIYLIIPKKNKCEVLIYRNSYKCNTKLC